MDPKLIQQIHPFIARAEKIPNLKFKDKESLTADLYLGIVKYYNKEIPKFLGRLDRLEILKAKKDKKYIDNIKRQQDTILEESKEKQNDLLSGIYNNWIDSLSQESFR